MSTSRRTFLKTAAAIPAVSIIGGAPSHVAAAASPAADIPVAVATAYPFRWWVSSDGGEMFHTECETRDEAIREARGYGGSIIAECQQQDFDLGLTGDNVIEQLYSQNEEIIGDGDFIQCTKEQTKDLGDMVTAAILAWADKHNIHTTAWTFGDVRNREEIGEGPIVASGT